MNHTTFEKSKRLKEAGFPQPKPEAGQVWFDLYGKPFVILNKSADRNPYLKGRYDFAYFKSGAKFSDTKLSRGRIFAPTATDILREMPGYYHLYQPFNSEFWICDNATEDEWSESSNPAEAAALAYLQIKEHEPIPNH